jgi:membrane protease YdiL (CAAX protease family)
VLSPLFARVGGGAAELGLGATSTTIALVLATALLLRRAEHKPWSWVHLGREAARPARLLSGTALGIGAIAVPTLALAASGWLAFTPAAEGSSLLTALLLAVTLLPAACAEELLLRGYVFSVLAERWGATVTVLATSVVFGALHWANPGANWQSILVVTLAGIFLSGVLLATRSLYAACAAHLGWNWALAGLLHAPVSGLPFEVPDFRLVDAGPDWATGGAWGPEGGAGAVVGLVSGISYLYLRRRRREEP